MPKDFAKPEGIDIKFQDNDPTLAAARQVAQKAGLTQDQFSQFVGLYAADRVNQVQAFNSAKAAELQKLGPTAPARIDALKTFFNARLGEAAAKPIIDSLFTAAHVQSLEKVVAVFASQGAGGFSQSGRDPGDAGGRLTEQHLSTMSISERLDYARRMSGKAA